MGVLCHIDNIFRVNVEEHDKKLHSVLQKIREEVLTLNREKCEFHKTSVTF